MKLFSIILFSILILVGQLSMASFIANPEAVNRFKHKINYTAIIAKLPEDGLGVYLDWEDTLKHLLSDEPSWEAEDRSTSITFPFHAKTRLSYENDDDARIDLEVHLFSDLSNTEGICFYNNTTHFVSSPGSLFNGYPELFV
jgi:hypothetical protein